MDTLSDPLVGQVLDGRYEVVSRIARGGMGTVYVALDRRLDRDVALKVMHAHLADDEALVDRFTREARAAARLSHPGVVAVFDQGSDATPSGRCVYLAMEHLPGRTLRDLLHERGPLSVREALALLEPVCEALGAAHRAGLVHRDVKPENVLLGEDGRVKVADFGLARAVTAGTTTGALLGTVAYLAPELVEHGRGDARSDVYACGVVLYELLTGRQPYEGEVPIQVAFRHVNDDVPPPSLLEPGLPPAVDDVVRVATARDPRRRPVDAAALAEVLRDLRESLDDVDLDRPPAAAALPASSGPSPDGATQVVPRPPQRTAPTRAGGADDAAVGRAPRRGRRGAGLLALLLLVAAVAVGGWWALLGPGATTAVPAVAGSSADDAEAALAAAGFGVERSEAFSDDVAEGVAVGTDPPAGEQARDGSDVELVVSAGPDVVPVPDLAGRTVDEARAALEEAGLALGEQTPRYSDEVEAGRVVSSTPAAGQEHRRGEPVTVVVSEGPEPVAVPTVVGQQRDAALQALAGVRLEGVVEAEEFSDDAPAGVVVRQSPAEGALLPGERVSLVVSKGPPLVAVPDVTRQQLAQARRVLEEAGFVVRVEEVLGGFFGTVRAQDPRPGSQVPRGSTITLTVV